MNIKEVIDEEGIDARIIYSWRVPNNVSPKAAATTEPTPLKPPKSQEKSEPRSGRSSKPTSSSPKVASGSKVPDSAAFHESTSGRLWRILLQNLNRSIDELYDYCDEGGGEELCKEALELLHRNARDFQNLMDRHEQQRQFEIDPTTSVSWEIRKPSQYRRHVSSQTSTEDGGDQNPGPGRRDGSASISSKLRAAAKPFVPSSQRAIEASSDGASLEVATVADQTAPQSPSLVQPQSSKKQLPSTSPRWNEATNQTDDCAASSESNNRNDDNSGNSNSVLDKESVKRDLLSAIVRKNLESLPLAVPVSSGLKRTVSSSSLESSNRRRSRSSASNSLFANHSNRNSPRTVRSNTVSSDRSTKSTAYSQLNHSTASEVGEADAPVDPALTEEREKLWREVEAWIEAEAAVEDAYELLHRRRRNTDKRDQLPPQSPDSTAMSTIDEETLGHTPGSSLANTPNRPVDEPVETSLECMDEESFSPERKQRNGSDAMGQIASPLTLPSSTYPAPAVKSAHPDELIKLSKLSIEPPNAPAIDVPPEFRTPPSSSKMTGSGRPHGDLASSCGPLSPPHSASRSLHEKLSSPDRNKRGNLSPAEARRRQEARLLSAESNRDHFVAEKRQKAMISSTRYKLRCEREAQRLAQAEMALEDKLREAQKRHVAYVKMVRGKAGNENAKVSEVMFINALNEVGAAEEMQQKLDEAEARIFAAAQRRNERLEEITVQQRKRNLRRAKQMSELRMQDEIKKMERWDQIQSKIQAVQLRRQARMAKDDKRESSSTASSARRRSFGQLSMISESEIPVEEVIYWSLAIDDGSASVPIASNSESLDLSANNPESVETTVAVDKILLTAENLRKLPESASSSFVKQKKKKHKTSKRAIVDPDLELLNETIAREHPELIQQISSGVVPAVVVVEKASSVLNSPHQEDSDNCWNHVLRNLFEVDSALKGTPSKKPKNKSRIARKSANECQKEISSILDAFAPKTSADAMKFLSNGGLSLLELILESKDALFDNSGRLSSLRGLLPLLFRVFQRMITFHEAVGRLSTSALLEPLFELAQLLFASSAWLDDEGTTVHALVELNEFLRMLVANVDEKEAAALLSQRTLLYLQSHPVSTAVSASTAQEAVAFSMFRLFLSVPNKDRQSFEDANGLSLVTEASVSRIWSWFLRTFQFPSSCELKPEMSWGNCSGEGLKTTYVLPRELSSDLLSMTQTNECLEKCCVAFQLLRRLSEWELGWEALQVSSRLNDMVCVTGRLVQVFMMQSTAHVLQSKNDSNFVDNGLSVGRNQADAAQDLQRAHLVELLFAHIVWLLGRASSAVEIPRECVACLCRVPIHFFTGSMRNRLFILLVVLCFKRPRCIQVLKMEISVKPLVDMIQSFESTGAASSDAATLAEFLPKDMWREAIQAFSSGRK